MSDGDVLGHDRVGSGPRGVIVLNDWMCDTSTWDGARAYLDGECFSWAFADLRGYGRSRGRRGAFTVLEAATDVLALADAIGWSRFAIVGHSMSALVALHLAQHHADRAERAVLLTPPPPGGFGADDARLEGMRALARGDDAMRTAALAERFGDRLSRGWAAFKVARWGATADRDAAAAYVAMFARDGVPDRTARVSIPVLAVTGEQDVPPMRRDAVVQNLTHLCDRLEVAAIAGSGHYPMQEIPPLTVALVERFLAAGTG
jgi:pimeloyl-ACP methyl ester carboxylesterase